MIWRIRTYIIAYVKIQNSKPCAYMYIYIYNSWDILNLVSMVKSVIWYSHNRSFLQIPQRTCLISHNTPFRTELCASEWCIVGYGTLALFEILVHLQPRICISDISFVYSMMIILCKSVCWSCENVSICDEIIIMNKQVNASKYFLAPKTCLSLDRICSLVDGLWPLWKLTYVVLL